MSHMVFAENSNCRGDCVAPTIGTLDDGQIMVTNGFMIKGHAFDITGYSQKIPTTSVLMDETITVKMLVYENSGIQALRQVDFILSDYKDDRNRNDKASISFTQDFTGAQKVNILDHSKILNKVKVTATPVDQFITSIALTFAIQKPLETSSIIIDMVDDSRSLRRNILVDAIVVENKLTVLKDVKEKSSKISDKASEKKDVKEKSSKTQVAKGKKNQRINIR